MQFEQQRELSRLAYSAAVAINATAESGAFTHVFSFWRLPAFDNHTRTTLYSPRPADSSKQPFFTVTTWRRDVDVDKLRDPVERLKHPRVLKPTIEECAINVAPDVVTSIVAELAEISLPVLRPNEGIVGLDGASFRFSFSQGLYALDFTWWSGHPKWWRAAAQKIEDLVSKLEDHGHHEA